MVGAQYIKFGEHEMIVEETRRTHYPLTRAPESSATLTFLKKTAEKPKPAPWADKSPWAGMRPEKTFKPRRQRG